MVTCAVNIFLDIFIIRVCWLWYASVLVAFILSRCLLCTATAIRNLEHITVVSWRAQLTLSEVMILTDRRVCVCVCVEGVLVRPSVCLYVCLCCLVHLSVVLVSASSVSQKPTVTRTGVYCMVHSCQRSALLSLLVLCVCVLCVFINYGTASLLLAGWPALQCCQCLSVCLSSVCDVPRLDVIGYC